MIRRMRRFSSFLTAARRRHHVLGSRIIGF